MDKGDVQKETKENNHTKRNHNGNQSRAIDPLHRSMVILSGKRDHANGHIKYVGSSSSDDRRGRGMKAEH